MLAIFKTGGKQYSVIAGQIVKVEKLEGNKGDSISFDNVLALSETSNHTFGNPYIKGATIKAKILEQTKDKKIIVFKKRKRQNYRHTQGHRQLITVLKIESISLGNKKNEISKTETLQKKETTKKTDLKKKTKSTIRTKNSETTKTKKGVIKKKTRSKEKNKIT